MLVRVIQERSKLRHQRFDQLHDGQHERVDRHGGHLAVKRIPFRMQPIQDASSVFDQEQRPLRIVAQAMEELRGFSPNVDADAMLFDHRAIRRSLDDSASRRHDDVAAVDNKLRKQLRFPRSELLFAVTLEQQAYRGTKALFQQGVGILEPALQPSRQCLSYRRLARTRKADENDGLHRAVGVDRLAANEPAAALLP